MSQIIAPVENFIQPSRKVSINKNITTNFEINKSFFLYLYKNKLKNTRELEDI